MKRQPVHTELTHAYLVFFRGDCNDTNSDWNFLPLLTKALLPQTRDEGPLRVNTSLAVSEEFCKVSRAFLICSLTALIINWGAIVPGQLSTVYSAPSLGLAELTQSCPFNFLNWQLLLTFMWKWSTVPGYVWRNSDVYCTSFHRLWITVRVHLGSVGVQSWVGYLQTVVCYWFQITWQKKK